MFGNNNKSLFPSAGIQPLNGGLGSTSLGGGLNCNALGGGSGLGGLGGNSSALGGGNGGGSGANANNNKNTNNNNENQSKGENLVLEEEMDENYEPTDQEIAEYAEWLGMDIESDEDLLWIAKEGLKAPLPNPWKPCQTQEGEIFYFNFESGESVWDHPCDEHYRKVFEEEKKKREQRKLEEAQKEQQKNQEEKKEKKKKKEKREKTELGPPMVGNTPRGSLSVAPITKSLTKKDAMGLDSVSLSATPRADSSILLGTPRLSPEKTSLSKDHPAFNPAPATSLTPASASLAPASMTLAPAKDLQADFDKLQADHDKKLKEEEYRLEEEFRKKRNIRERELEAEMKGELAEKTSAMQIQIKKEMEKFEKTEKSEFEKWKQRLESEFNDQKRNMENNLKNDLRNAEEAARSGMYSEEEVERRVESAASEAKRTAEAEARRASQDEIFRLESELRVSKERERNLVTAKDRKNQECEDLEKKLSEKNGKIEELEYQMRKEKRDLEEERNRSRSELDGKIFELETRMRTLDLEKNDMQSRLNDQMERNKRLIEEKAADTGAGNAADAASSGAVEILERKCRELEADLEASRKNAEEQTRLKEDAINDKNKLEMDKLRVEQDKDQAVRELGSEKQIFELRISELKTKADEAERRIPEAVSAALSKEREMQQRVRAELESDFDSKSTREQGKIRELETKFESEKAEWASEKRRLEDDKRRLEDEKRRLDEDKAFAEMESDRDKKLLESDKSRLERENREAEMRVHEIQRKLESKEQDNEALRSSNDRVLTELRAQIDDLNRKESSVKQDFDSRLDGKEAQLAQQRVDLERLQSRATEAATQLDIERSRYKTISQNYEVLLEEKQELLKKLEDSNNAQKHGDKNHGNGKKRSDTNTFGLTALTSGESAEESGDDDGGIMFFNNGEEQKMDDGSKAALESDLLRMKEDNRQMRMTIDRLELDMKEERLKAQRADQEVKEEKQEEIRRLERRVAQLTDDIAATDRNLVQMRSRADAAEKNMAPLRESVQSAERKLKTVRQEAEEARDNFVFRIENLETLLDEEKTNAQELRKQLRDKPKSSPTEHSANRSLTPSDGISKGSPGSGTGGSPKMITGMYSIEDVQREREQGKQEAQSEFKNQFELQAQQNKKALEELELSHKQQVESLNTERKNLLEMQLTLNEKHGKELQEVQRELEEKIQAAKSLEVEKQTLQNQKVEIEERLERFKQEKQQEYESQLESVKKELEAKSQNAKELLLMEERQKFEDKIRAVEQEKRAALEGASSISLDMQAQLEEKDDLEKKFFILQNKHEVLEKKHEGITEQMKLVQERAEKADAKNETTTRDLNSREEMLRERYEEIRRKNDDVRRAQDEQRKLEVKLRDIQAENLQLKSESEREKLLLKEQSRRKVEEAQLDVKDMQKTIAGLESKASTIESILLKERELTSELSVKNLELTKVKTQIEEELKGVEAKDEQISKLKLQISEFEKEKMNILDQVQQAQKQVGEQSNEKQDLEKQLKTKLDEVEKQHRTKIEELEKRHRTKIDELESKHNAQKIRTSEELRAQYEGKMRDGLNEAEERRKEEEKQWRQKLEAAKLDAEGDAKREAQKVEQQFEQQLAEVHHKGQMEVDKVRREYESKMESEKSEKGLFKQQTNELENEKEDLVKQITNLKEQVKEKSEALKQTEQDLEASKKDRTASEETQAVERKLKDKQNELSSTKETLTSIKDTLEKREKEVKRLETLLAEKVREKELSIQKLKSQVERLRFQKSASNMPQASPSTSSELNGNREGKIDSSNKHEYSMYASFVSPTDSNAGSSNFHKIVAREPNPTKKDSRTTEGLQKDIQDLRLAIESMKGQESGIKTSSQDRAQGKKVKSGTEVGPNTVVKKRENLFSDDDRRSKPSGSNTRLSKRQLVFSPDSRRVRQSIPTYSQAQAAQKRVSKAQTLLQGQKTSLRKIHRILESDRKRWRKDWADCQGRQEKRILLAVRRTLDQQAERLNNDVREAKAMEKSLAAKQNRIEKEIENMQSNGQTPEDDFGLKDGDMASSVIGSGSESGLPLQEILQIGHDENEFLNENDNLNFLGSEDLFEEKEREYLRKIVHGPRKEYFDEDQQTRWGPRFTESQQFDRTENTLFQPPRRDNAMYQSGEDRIWIGIPPGAPLNAQQLTTSTSDSLRASLNSNYRSGSLTSRVPANERHAAIRDALDFNVQFSTRDNDDLWQRWRNMIDTQDQARAERANIRLEERRLNKAIEIGAKVGADIVSVPAGGHIPAAGHGLTPTAINSQQTPITSRFSNAQANFSAGQPNFSAGSNFDVQMWFQNRTNLREALTSQIGFMRSIAAECNSLQKRAYSARGSREWSLPLP